MGDRSLSVYVQNLIQSCQANPTAKSKMNSSNYFGRMDREMSLAEHIRSRTNDRRDTKFWYYRYYCRVDITMESEFDNLKSSAREVDENE